MKNNIFTVSMLDTPEGKDAILKHFEKNRLAIFVLDEREDIQVGIAIALNGSSNESLMACQREKHCADIFQKLDEKGFFEMRLPHELKSIKKVRLY